jgi:chromosomal replication initiation ATPase DnaA
MKAKTSAFDAKVAQLVEMTEPARTPIREIVSAVSRQTGIPEMDIYGESRSFPIAKARHMAWYLAREDGHFFTAVADVFGRDHTSIIHGYNRIKQDMEAYA